MIIYICDNCKTEFSQALDQEVYKDEHGILHTLDLCAPCRAKRAKAGQKADNEFFEKIVKKEVKSLS